MTSIFLALPLIKNGLILTAKIEVLAVFYNETLGGVELFLVHNKVGRSGNMLAGKNPEMSMFPTREANFGHY